MKLVILLLGILSTTVINGGVERAIKRLGVNNPQQVLSHLKGRRDGKQVHYIVNSVGKDSEGYLFYRQDLSLMVKEVRVVDGSYYPGNPRKLGRIVDQLIRPEIKECLQASIAEGKCRDLANPLTRDELLDKLAYDPFWDTRKIALIAGVAKRLGLKSIASGSGENRSYHYLEQQTFADVQKRGGLRYSRLDFFLANNPKLNTVKGVSELEIADFLGLTQLSKSFHSKAKRYLTNVEIWQTTSSKKIYVRKGIMEQAVDDFIAKNEQVLKTKGYYNNKFAFDDVEKNFRAELPIPQLIDRQYNSLIRKAIERGKLAISNNLTFSGKDRRGLSWLFWPGHTPEEQLGIYLRRRGGIKVAFPELSEAFSYFLMPSDKDYLPADYAIKSIIHGTGVRGETRRRAGGDLVPYLTKVAQEELGDHMDRLGVLDGSGLPSFRRPAYGKEKARDIIKVISE